MDWIGFQSKYYSSSLHVMNYTIQVPLFSDSLFFDMFFRPVSNILESQCIWWEFLSLNRLILSVLSNLCDWPQHGAISLNQPSTIFLFSKQCTVFIFVQVEKMCRVRFVLEVRFVSFRFVYCIDNGSWVFWQKLKEAIRFSTDTQN